MSRRKRKKNGRKNHMLVNDQWVRKPRRKRRKHRRSHKSGFGHKHGYNIHHRKSRHTGGGNGQDNLCQVPIIEHNAYNILFDDGHMPPPLMAKKLNDCYIDPDYVFIARRKDSVPCLQVIRQL